MGKRLLHTPEGVRDIYGEEFVQKLNIQDRLHQKILEYGYQSIQTPTLEFFDVFSKQVGTVSSKELYKLFDKEGNTLVLRPDFTPSIARCAAKYFMEESMPMRFCYLGNTYTNTSELQGKLKEVTQFGAELIGDDSAHADAEMIALSIESLINAGLTDFQVSIGEIDFFKGLCEEAGLSLETELHLKDFISNKNHFGAQELLKEESVDDAYIDIILKVTDLFGNAESVSEAKKYVKNDRSLAAIDRLLQVYRILTCYGLEKYVAFDLGMLSKYNYYTGVIFKVYTFGVGDAIVKGGRYDTLLMQFGKESPAIGFMIVVDDLLSALSRQGIMPEIKNKKCVMLCKETDFEAVLKLTGALRAEGKKVEIIFRDKNKSTEDYILFSKKQSAGCLIEYTSSNNIMVYHLHSGRVSQHTEDDIQKGQGLS